MTKQLPFVASSTLFCSLDIYNTLYFVTYLCVVQTRIVTGFFLEAAKALRGIPPTSLFLLGGRKTVVTSSYHHHRKSGKHLTGFFINDFSLPTMRQRIIRTMVA